MWRLKFCFCRFFESTIQVSFKTYELINYTRDNKIKCSRPWPSFGEYCKSSRYEFVELVVVFTYDIEWFKTRRILQPGTLNIADPLETAGIFDGPEVTARYSAIKQTSKTQSKHGQTRCKVVTAESRYFPSFTVIYDFIYCFSRGPHRQRNRSFRRFPVRSNKHETDTTRISRKLGSFLETSRVILSLSVV